MRLLDYIGDVFSQSGEDGVIAKILETLPRTDKWCVEFGAWDGEYLSNTRHLIKDKGYSGVLIEGGADKYRDLLKRYGGDSRVHCLQGFVGFSAADSLDVYLQRTPIPRDFDLLSIDIDGNDYHVWKAVALYQPKAVVIEFNPTVPTECEFVQPPDETLSQGCGLLPLVKLGKEKGYELVATTLTNAFFVRAEYLPLFGIPDNRPAFLREDSSRVAHLFSGYDGTLFVQGFDRSVWNDIPYAWRLHQIPKAFRIYVGNMGPVRRFLFDRYYAWLKFLAGLRGQS